MTERQQESKPDSTYGRLSDAIMRSRAARLAAEEQPSSLFTRTKRVTVGTLRTGVEMLPGGMGPYGIGDFITLTDAIRGREFFGRKLDAVDRIICLIAALIPVMPATPLKALIRGVRRNLEDATAASLERHHALEESYYYTDQGKK